jgi:hypothetical protein
MNANEAKSLQPLTHGNILIVGVKASNLDEELKTHPRITVWDSQNENWLTRDVPDNTRVIFMTRFISHRTSERLLTEARKRQLTIFNPEGTGMIAKQVRELLGIVKSADVVNEVKTKGKLEPLHQFVDFSKMNSENAVILMAKANELGIATTPESLAMMVGNLRKKMHGTGVPKSIRAKVDVSVEILDSMIRQLQDMRGFLIATVDENNSLREKLSSLKKVFSE